MAIARFASGFLALACGIALGCSSTIDGSNDDPKMRTFDVAVGATVTLNLGDRNCNQDPPPAASGCLTGQSGIQSLQGVTVLSEGPFVVTGSKQESSSGLLVTIRAQSEGQTVLNVEYIDRIGNVAKDQFLLRALPITHVDEKVGCQWPDPQPPNHRYPIAQGSNLGVVLTAMNEAIPLLSGAMELVLDRGGLDYTSDPRTVDEGNALRRAITVPPVPGIHEWKLVGSRPGSVTFDVYDPATIGVDVAATSDKTVSVRPAVGDIATCTYVGTGRAKARVAGGDCRLLVGQYEVDGDLPVALDRGGASFVVSGNGSCTIEATVGGAIDRATLDVKPIEVAKKPAGKEVGTTPIENASSFSKRSTCLRVTKISNGKCEAINSGGYIVPIPDGDCFLDFSWLLKHYDTTSVSGSTKGIDKGEPVGVGLYTEVRIGLVLKLFGLIGVKDLVPNALKIGPTGLEWQSLGCESDYEALVVRAPAAGSHPLHFTADNAPNKLEWLVDARPIGRIGYLSEKTDTRVNGNETTSAYFVGSTADLKLTYAEGNGAPLRGIGSVLVSTNDASASVLLRGSDVYTGSKPNKVTLASPAAPLTHVLDVVDGSTIASVDGLAPQAGTRDEVCVEPFPKSAAGQRIHGTSPIRPRIAFAGGDACAVVGDLSPWSVGTAEGYKLCLMSAAGANTDVTIGWGQASASWACQKR